MTREQCKLAIENFERTRRIGEIDVHIPEPPKWTSIANYSLPAEKQFFPYPPVPKVITEEFLQEEVAKLNGGFWFFNGGRLEYISDTHYLLLSYWRDKGRKMVFVDAQRDVYLWWMQVEKEKNLAGGNLATNRRFGKSNISLSVLYKRTTSGPYRRGGMQSKTNEDVKTLFKKLISSWTQLPNFMKPIDSGESRPATILDFSEPRKRNTKDPNKIYGEALNSSIDHRASTEEAYDGEELYTMIEDEVGKTVGANTDTRYYIYRFCLQKGASITGKCLRTTTVEDMEKKGGANFKKTWDASRMATLNPATGRTESYLTNLFIPADYGYLGEHPITGVKFVDEHGYSNREAAREFILSLWEKLEGSDLSKAQQKDPLTERHMWQLKNFGGCFDNELLQAQLDYLERTNDHEDENAPLNLVRRVTFYRDETGVHWRDDKNGNCQMVWDFSDQSLSNKRVFTGGQWAPGNDESFAIGVDPIGATMTTGTEKSQAVAYVYRKGDMNDPENSGLMVLRYAPQRGSIRLKSDFHKYVMMLCQYYGCKANYESDVDDYYEKFIEEGFKSYVMWRPKCTIDPMRRNIKTKYGTPSKDSFALQKQHDIADEYIKTRYHKIYFVELVRKLINFDKDNRTEFDDCIAFFMALIGGVEKKMDNQPRTSALSILPTVQQKTSLPFRRTG